MTWIGREAQGQVHKEDVRLGRLLQVLNSLHGSSREVYCLAVDVAASPPEEASRSLSPRLDQLAAEVDRLATSCQLAMDALRETLERRHADWRRR